MSAEIGVKRFELMREMLPRAKRFGLLANPSTLNNSQTKNMQSAAASVGAELVIQYAATTMEIEQAFASFDQSRPDGILIEPETLFINSRELIAALLLRYKIPVISPFREDAVAGSLMSYGPSITDNARLAGMYAARILRGEKPADLTVLQPTKFESC